MKKPTSTTTSDSVEEMKKQLKDDWKRRFPSGDYYALYQQYMRRLAEDPRVQPMEYWVARLEKEYKEAEAYLRQVKESDGFDIDRNLIPYKNHYVAVVPAYSETKSDERTLSLKREVKEMAQFAIEYINSKQQALKYEFQEVLKANYEGMGSALLYYITFRASATTKDNNDDQFVFQAKVLDRLLARPRERKVIFFKVKGKAELIRAGSNAEKSVGEIANKETPVADEISTRNNVEKVSGPASYCVGKCLASHLIKNDLEAEGASPSPRKKACYQDTLVPNLGAAKDPIIAKKMIYKKRALPDKGIGMSKLDEGVLQIGGQVFKMSNVYASQLCEDLAELSLEKDKSEGLVIDLKKSVNLEEVEMKATDLNLKTSNVSVSQLREDLAEFSLEKDKSKGLMTDFQRGSQLCEDLTKFSLEKDKSEGLVTDLQRGVNLEEAEMKGVGTKRDRESWQRSTGD